MSWRTLGVRSRVVFRRIGTLVRQPVFIALTVIVHSIVALAGTALYALEHASNPKVCSWLDALYWAMATVTTVGYGDIAPLTASGKVLAMVLMVLGSLFTVLYTALFASALLAPEISHVEHSVREMEHDFKQLEVDAHTDAEEIAEHLRILLKNLDSRANR